MGEIQPVENLPANRFLQGGDTAPRQDSATGAQEKLSIEALAGAVDSRPKLSTSDVLIGTAMKLPPALAAQLSEDLAHNRERVAFNVATGAAAGAGVTALMKFTPRLGYVGLGVLAAKGLYDLGAGTLDFADKIENAPDRKTQEALSSEVAAKSGRTLADIVEGSPTAGLSATATSRISAERAGELVAPLANRLAFMGPGTQSLPGSIARGKTFDALALARILDSRHPWLGVESGSMIDLQSLKLSRMVRGSEDRLPYLPAQNKEGTLSFHTHKPERLSLPGPSDVGATTNIGMVSSGGELTIFMGQRSELRALMSQGRGDEFQAMLRSVTVDEKAGKATRLSAVWDESRRGWAVSERTALDFEATRKAFGSLMPLRDHAWLDLAAIARQQ